ncbi:hypothetical protein LWI29_024185 [Acer saccharum]|uniref:Reverse transcriptase zinc-binding domain-containing protein n=1 Tax=Acer saccharum TaxID=4024 RepID=A0AA39RL73_ACESA|nr:hypothetical protein LWI29_024185 [Acer saccharum]
MKFGYIVSVAKDTSKSTSGSNGCDDCQKTIWSHTHTPSRLVFDNLTVFIYFNGPLLEDIFLEEDVQGILSIPTSASFRDDSLCWHFTKDEKYTVKFGYMVSVAKDTSKSTSGSNGCDGCQKTIWSLGVPLKIKVFLWRVCKNQSLLVNLAKRKVPVSGLCPVCSNSFENIVHAMWNCSDLKVVRYMFGTSIGWKRNSSGSFHDFFVDCVHRLESEVLRLLCIVLWRIWFLRN